MRSFEALNPAVTAIYFLLVSIIPMFSMNPLLLLASVCGAAALFVIRNGLRHMRMHLFFIGLFCVTAVINPIFYNNGSNVLFIMNDNPVTLESAIYGVFAATALLSVLYWFRTFTQIMTSDRLLYVFGSLSPKLSLVLSMALRSVPLLERQTAKVRRAQKCLGLYAKDDIISDLRSESKVFSIIVTWALENGIITANSMTARGYGLGKRTHFSLYRIRKQDIFFLVTSLLLFAVTLAVMLTGGLAVTYYPHFCPPPLSTQSLAGGTAYTLLAFLPSFFKAEEYFKWKYLKSKI